MFSAVRSMVLRGLQAATGSMSRVCRTQATLFCSVAQRITYGTHEIIIGLVEKTTVAELISPLLWQDGKPAISVPLVA